MVDSLTRTSSPRLNFESWISGSGLEPLTFSASECLDRTHQYSLTQPPTQSSASPLLSQSNSQTIGCFARQILADGAHRIYLGRRSKTRVTQLRPGRVYAFCVRSRNAACPAWGSFSSWRLIATSASCPDAPLAAPRVEPRHAIGASGTVTATEAATISVHVAWDPVDQVNGAPVLEYRLEWQQTTNSTDFLDLKEATEKLRDGFQMVSIMHICFHVLS
ncbi:unnamed protein product [Protopolystoma xenopodis]|uniref:Fibronectin type-III domain-containing protein n=1 Tax=Protopolystoma xenopodis TaxID=117903 RepID=A0A448XFH6_9PLAT|nr:unnamed protein product [Protopolystoma xenopodis]